MVTTGKQPITVMALLAILSISLVVNLPGLAVTPMLGSLSKVFPHTTQLEKQLLTSLPNLLIIPFVLLSGKLSLTKHKIGVVTVALVIFTGCAVAYLFAKSMIALIVISCFLGCGAGLLIPFAAGLIADTFVGKWRMHTMGLKSGISNTSLVLATFLVGWLSHTSNWHIPFIVYLISAIPLVMTIWLRQIPKDDLNMMPPSSAASSGSSDAKATPAPATAANSATKPAASATADTSVAAAKGPKPVDGFYIGRLWAIIGVYSFITFATIVISYYCPFLIEKRDWSSSLTGTVTALFFLFMLIPGFTLSYFVKWLKGGSFLFSAVSMTVGMALFAFFPNDWTMCIGACLAGLGYGICQPLIYDKASQVVISDAKATLSLAFVLASNYVAIAATPFIIDGLRDLFHASGSATFAFLICFILLAIYTAISLLFRKSFAFNVNKSYYE